MKENNNRYKARKTLANNIYFFRWKLNLTQEKLAEKLGTTTTYLSNLENGKKNTRIDYVELIADTLDVTIEELFKERNPIDRKRCKRTN